MSQPVVTLTGVGSTRIDFGTGLIAELQHDQIRGRYHLAVLAPVPRDEVTEATRAETEAIGKAIDQAAKEALGPDADRLKAVADALVRERAALDWATADASKARQDAREALLSGVDPSALERKSAAKDAEAATHRERLGQLETEAGRLRQAIQDRLGAPSLAKDCLAPDAAGLTKAGSDLAKALKAVLAAVLKAHGCNAARLNGVGRAKAGEYLDRLHNPKGRTPVATEA